MSKILILGAGPSGLIIANYLKQRDYDFKIVSSGNHGFIPEDMNGIKFSLGQRTLFDNEELYGFLCSTVGDPILQMQNLNEKIGVLYKGKEYNYPIQNNLEKFRLFEQMKILFSYYCRNRKLSISKIYANWVRGNYGNWLADNIILPHTNKTLKEDLFTIYSSYYGKKVVKLSRKKKFVREFIYPQEIMECLFNNIKEHFIEKHIGMIHLDNRFIVDEDETLNGNEWKYDVLINTIALPKFLELIHTTSKEYTDMLSVAKDTLRWNNMLIVALLVPTDFISTHRSIVYFPERDYLFSKVYFQRLNGYTVITCEVSYRENDKRVKNKAFLNKIYEIVESDLKKSGLIINNDFISYFRKSHLIQPSYIICDKDYECNNIFIQHYLQHHGIYNVGRFAEWKPNLRVEDSVIRARKLVEKGIFEYDTD